MKTIAKIAVAATFAVGAASVAHAQSVPTVPNPANPAPQFPVATDGTPLTPGYVMGSPYDGIRSGRSVAIDAGGPLNPVGFAAGTAGAAVGVAGSVVNGTVGPFVNGPF